MRTIITYVTEQVQIGSIISQIEFMQLQYGNAKIAGRGDPTALIWQKIDNRILI